MSLDIFLSRLFAKDLPGPMTVAIEGVGIVCKILITSLFNHFHLIGAAMMLIGVLSFFIVAVFGELLIGGNVSPAERGPTV